MIKVVGKSVEAQSPVAAKPKPASFSEQIRAFIQAQLDANPACAGMVLGVHINEASKSVSLWAKSRHPKVGVFIDSLTDSLLFETDCKCTDTRAYESGETLSSAHRTVADDSKDQKASADKSGKGEADISIGQALAQTRPGDEHWSSCDIPAQLQHLLDKAPRIDNTEALKEWAHNGGMFRANDVVAKTVGMAIAERYFGLALNQGAGGPIAVLCIKPLVVGVAPVMISRRIGDAELSLLRGNENLTLTVVYEGALKLSEQTISDAFETIRTPRRFSLR